MTGTRRRTPSPRYVLSQIDRQQQRHSVFALRLRRATAVFAGLQSARGQTDAVSQRRLSSIPQLGGRSRPDPPGVPRAEPGGVQAVRDRARRQRPLRQSKPEGRAAPRQAGALRSDRRHEPARTRARDALGSQPVRWLEIVAGHRPTRRPGIRCRSGSRGCAGRGPAASSRGVHRSGHPNGPRRCARSATASPRPGGHRPDARGRPAQRRRKGAKP